MLKKRIAVLLGTLSVGGLVFAMTSCRLADESVKLADSAEVENTVRLCSDGIDNDGNGLIDCEDPACLDKGTPESVGPGVIVCPHEMKDGKVVFLENNLYTCTDGIDNDGDGYVDCMDNSCKQTTACCPTGEQKEISEEECSDGIDNNCNGYIDCADRTCWFNGKGAEYCRKIKCPAGSSPENTEEACSDGIDNDCNGYIDCVDNKCKQTEYCKNLLSRPDSHETDCQDQYDNDLNGLVDCDDPACSDDPYCQGLTQEPPDRPDDFAQMSKQERAAILQLEFTMCTDGIDNDRNGRMDCHEYRCVSLSQRKLTGDEAVYQIHCDD
ncbi:MAG: hypothetical protein WC966_07250 [Bradymonadales bacterium]